ncbi:hypothetical protein EJ04DRAFT_525235 [Polyplosphaeria fusca]|uniref:C3H1-type domain-containing protein n=1 Tax=Polyplosphaeria fusca TaxID=682080 RepID=A0A9P4QVY7_9PLEO|nr:hypothetical protein EJ04DRAFT_525235 [Polyplosphaeria fusca]
MAGKKRCRSGSHSGQASDSPPGPKKGRFCPPEQTVKNQTRKKTSPFKVARYIVLVQSSKPSAVFAAPRPTHANELGNVVDWSTGDEHDGTGVTTAPAVSSKENNGPTACSNSQAITREMPESRGTSPPSPSHPVSSKKNNGSTACSNGQINIASEVLKSPRNSPLSPSYPVSSEKNNESAVCSNSETKTTSEVPKSPGTSPSSLSHEMSPHTPEASTPGKEEASTSSNTPPCRFFQRGFCMFGSDCRYEHQDGIETQSDGKGLKKGIVCRYFLEGRCNRPDCAFDHPEGHNTVTPSSSAPEDGDTQASTPPPKPGAAVVWFEKRVSTTNPGKYRSIGVQTVPVREEDWPERCGGAPGDHHLNYHTRITDHFRGVFNSTTKKEIDMPTPKPGYNKKTCEQDSSFQTSPVEARNKAISSQIIQAKTQALTLSKFAAQNRVEVKAQSDRAKVVHSERLPLPTIRFKPDGSLDVFPEVAYEVTDYALPNLAMKFLEPTGTSKKAQGDGVEKPIPAEVKPTQTEIKLEAKPIVEEVKHIQTEGKSIQTEIEPIRSEIKPTQVEAKPIAEEIKPIQAEVKPKSTEAPHQSQDNVRQSTDQDNSNMDSTVGSQPDRAEYVDMGISCKGAARQKRASKTERRAELEVYKPPAHRRRDNARKHL